jgi:tetratricopeptide (TPR) repeat protein
VAGRVFFCQQCGAYLPETVDSCPCGFVIPAAGAEKPDELPIGGPALISAPDLAYPSVAALSLPVSPSIPTPHDFASEPSQPAAISTGTKKQTTLVAAAALALVVIVVSVVVYKKMYSFDARIDRALAAGHIFSPPGECAVDVYAAAKANSPMAPEVQAAGEKIAAMIAPMGDDAFRRWYLDSEGVDWDQTEKIYAFLQEVKPGDNATRVRHEYALGTVRLNNQNHADALNHFTQALQLDSSFTLAVNGIAKIYLQDTSPLKNEVLGVQFCQRAVAMDPKFTWALKNLGDFYVRKEDWRSAEEPMLKALATSPNRPSILRALGRIYYGLKLYPQALDYDQRFLQVSKDPDAIARANNAIAEIRKHLSL